MAGLALLKEDCGKNRCKNDRNDNGCITPATCIPAEGEVRHLIDTDEECTILCEVNRVQIDTSGYRLHEGEHCDGLRNTEGHHDRKYDNTDCDNRTCTGHCGEDDRGYDVEKRDGYDRLITAELYGLTNKCRSDTSLHEHAAEPCTPAYVYEGGTPAFRCGLEDLVEDRHDLHRLTVAVKCGGGEELRCCKVCTKQGQNRPCDRDQQEADHQVVALNAIICETEE